MEFSCLKLAIYCVTDKKNCNSYYRCVLGEFRKEYCAGGLHWNKERLVCDWPAMANCKESSGIMKPTTTTTATTKKPVRVSKRTTTASPTTTSPKPQEDESESCVSGQYYPHEFCDHFYVCVNGQKVKQRCGPGLHWNVAKGSCDWAFKVECKKQKHLLQRKKVYTPYANCKYEYFALEWLRKVGTGSCSCVFICSVSKTGPAIFSLRGRRFRPAPRGLQQVHAVPVGEIRVL